MTLLGKKSILGLDIGQASVKAILISRSGRNVSIEACGALDLRTEGIIDEAELYRELRPWLEKNGWHKYEITANIPQYIASTQVTDFPPGSDRSLDEMVAYETRQLAGLSEEVFLHDYQTMPAKFGRRNPVLIGICRESVIAERAESLTDAGIMISDLTIASTALAAAYLHQYPNAMKSDSPQLLLDIGAENTTAAIVAGGNLLYTASLMCGTDHYVQALSKKLNISLEEAEREKAKSRINPVEKTSAYMDAARIFESEIYNTIDQWRSDERPEIGRIQFSKVCICGGGAFIAGLDAFLGKLLDCPAEIIGVPTAEDKQRNPLSVTALGLALQGAGLSNFSVSLVPEALRRQVHHRRRFPYMAAAAVMIACLIGLVLSKHSMDISRQQNELEAVKNKLNRSEAIVPDLEEASSKIELLERMILPYAAKCNHTGQLAAVMEQLGKARLELQQNNLESDSDAQSNVWVVYLADEMTYHAGKENSSDSSRGNGETPLIFHRSPWDTSETQTSRTRGVLDATSHTVKSDVTRLEPWSSFVAAIYAFQPSEQPLSKVRDFIETLSRSDVFEDSTKDRVDTFQDKDIRGREDIFRPWLNSSVNLRNYRRAVIRIPYSIEHLAVKPTGSERQAN